MSELKEKAKGMYPATRNGIVAKAPNRQPVTARISTALNSFVAMVVQTTNRTTGALGSFVDACVSIVAPGTALTRIAARQAIRTFDASLQNRLNADIDFSQKNADTEIRYKRLPGMAISREEMRNDPWYSNALRTSRNNVIGDDESRQGIDIQAAVKDKSGELRKDLNDEINSWWHFYKNRLHLTGRWGFTELCSVFHNSYKTSGEVLGVIRDIPALGSDLPFSIEELEPDHLPTSGESWAVPFAPEQSMPDGHSILDGIERDRMNRIVGYHILKFHPGNEFLWQSLQTVYFPQERVIHYYEPLRPEQSRGMPFGISGLNTIADVNKISDNELKRQKIQAMYGVHFTKPIGSFTPSGVNGVTDAQGRAITEMQPGLFTTGPQQVEMYGSATPNPALGEFLMFNGRRIAASSNMSYSSVTKDYSNMSFNSGRLEQGEDWRGYRFDQGMHTRNLIKKKIWPAFINALIVADKLATFNDLDLEEYTRKPGDEGYDPRARANFEECDVTLPESEYVDPEKEGRADDAAVAGGYKLPQEVIGKRNPEMHFKRYAEAVEMAKKSGLDFSWMKGFTVGSEKATIRDEETGTGDIAKADPNAPSKAVQNPKEKAA